MSLFTPNFDLVGMVRAKNEARWIKDCITSMFAAGCSDVYVMDNSSTDETASIALDCGAIVFKHRPWYMDEAAEKTILLDKVSNNADVIIHLDGDEFLDVWANPKGWSADLKRLALGDEEDSKPIVLAPRVRYLWDSPSVVRTDGVYENMRRPSVFQTNGWTNAKFLPTRHPHNLHCGNVPQKLLSRSCVVNSQCDIIHYGYMLEEDRARKYEYYNKLDPMNDSEGRYAHIIGQPSPHAGPTIRLEQRPL